MRGGSSERTRRAWTVTVIAVMLAWFGITNHVPLEPLNDLSQQGDQLPSTLAGFIPFVLAILTVLFVPNFWLVLFWTGYAYVWLALQAGTWWIPYLLGGSAEHWSSYRDTLNVLPALDGRIGPDVQHLVLQILSLAMAVMLTVLTGRLWRNRRRRR
ncbi:MAG TPA: DUF202 domain-containing protein [Candidatus Brachybacterium merdavium]|uniref:DUF202 domain-containing protein n=1 Tax=Candidatus Brachybacterium merdavium TaxID=2838513 RepID=A0A9D2RP08_9MICO|nr:DUF202 domain-containing protein [Candidatus Brachybacterium merdavium]